MFQTFSILKRFPTNLYRHYTQTSVPPSLAYLQLHQHSIKNPEAFWSGRAESLDWFAKPTSIFEELPLPPHSSPSSPSPASPSRPFLSRWFPDGLINICYNCVDRHVLSGHGHLPALVFDSAMTRHADDQTLSYAQLLRLVESLALALLARGLQPGDRVLLYMPMVPLAVVAMLAIARIGAIHVIVFGGFSGVELGRRLVDVKPALVLTASAGIEPSHTVPYLPLLEDAFRCNPGLLRPRLGTMVLQRRPHHVAELDERHYTDWEAYVEQVTMAFLEHGEEAAPLNGVLDHYRERVKQQHPPIVVNNGNDKYLKTKHPFQPHHPKTHRNNRIQRKENLNTLPPSLGSGQIVPCQPMPTDAPLFVLHTSGTTGTPKGLIRSHGDYAVMLDTAMSLVYAMPRRQGTWWAASDIGWIVGHSFSVYGPLLHGNATLLYEGKPVGTPDAGAWGRIIAQHRVEGMFAAPTALRAIRGADPDARCIRSHDLSSLRHLFVAGERCDVATLRWARAQFQCPVVDHYWMTESGSPMVANCAGVALSAVPEGSVGLPVMGYEIAILDSDTGAVVTEARREGDICVKLPLPPGFSTSLWPGSTEFFAKKYLSRWDGWFFTSDVGYQDEHGYFFVLSRSDDVMNVAGHRLSGGALEELISTHPAVAECAVVGAADAIKGEVPVGFVVLKEGSEQEEIEAQIVQLVREKFGAVAAFKRCCVIPKLPKTRSGKTLRKTLKSLYEKEENFVIPPTIEDINVIQDLKNIFQKKK